MIENAMTLVEIRYRDKVIPAGAFIKVDSEQLIALWADDHFDIFPTEYKLIYLN
jgi:hypothetical protein